MLPPADNLQQHRTANGYWSRESHGRHRFYETAV